jgi:hypothetical protein
MEKVLKEDINLPGRQKIKFDFTKYKKNLFLNISDEVSDSDVFRPPGSRSVCTSYGTGSGSFYHPAKLVRKTFIPPVL